MQRVDLLLPAEWSEIEAELSVAGGFEKNITKKGDRQLLSLLLRTGQTTDFSVFITANGAQRKIDEALAAPSLEVLNVVKQSGSLVVQLDPAYDAQWESTTGCEMLPLNATYGWLSVGKRATGRLALRWTAPGYTAALQVKPKLPRLETKLLHNVKVTAKTIEQTTLVEYRVSQAGIGEVTVLLPAALRTARINARNVRRQTVEEKGDKIPAGFVRLRVELEDEFLGQYQLLLEHDRLLTSGQQTLALPALDQGTGRRRLVMVESAGRDEVVIEKTVGLEPLTRGQQAFTELVAALGVEPTQAYIAKQGRRITNAFTSFKANAKLLPLLPHGLA